MAATTVVNGRLDAGALARLDAWAAAAGVSRSVAVARLLRSALGGDDAGAADPAPTPRPAPAARTVVVEPVKRTAAVTAHPKPIPAKTVDARAVLAAAEREAAHLARPRPKGPRAGAAKASDDDIGYTPAAWGENRAAPGSRLKGVQKLR